MSLLQFLRILAARRAILLAILLSCFATAVVVSQLLPKRYEARSRIILDLVKPDPVTGQLISNQFLQAYVRTQIELIQDERTAGRVVDALGWASNPAIVAQFSEDMQSSDDIRTVLAKRISDGTQAQLLDRSNILEIIFTWSDPEAARQIADVVRATYIDLSLQNRRDTASRTAEWYRDQADKAQRLLTAAQGERAGFAKANGIVLQSDNTDLESAKLAALSTQSAIPIVGAAAAAPPSAANLQLDQINQQIAQAATTLGPNHPVFQALQRQRAVLEAEAARQRGATSSLGSPGASMAQIEQAYQTQKTRVVAQRDKIDRLNQMQNDIELKRDQYVKASQRAADFRLEADVGDTGMTPLGTAAASSTPTYPNIPLIIMGSIGLGAMLGICIALLVEMLGRRVRSDDDLAIAAAAPVFAVVGDSRNPDGWIRRLIRFVGRKSRSRRGTELVESAA